jgi:DNA-binding response OmpR family regulator
MVLDLLAGQHVVVVDDDERLLALARLALQKQGVRVSTAATAAEGRTLIGADPPDLVILDIVLPDMSGWEVLRRIRETDDCLVMLLSGRDSDIDKARGLDLGADDYLTKPFSFLEFEARVRALLRRAPARGRPDTDPPMTTVGSPQTKTDQQTAVIQVMTLTARAGLADQPLAAEAGADTHLTKPFSPATLPDAVRSVLRTARAT